jgi:hypothetical protein
MITITKYTGRIILLSQTKRCTNTFDLDSGSTKVQKKRLSKLVLFTDKKEKKSKKGSNRREEEKKGIQQRLLQKKNIIVEEHTICRIKRYR